MSHVATNGTNDTNEHEPVPRPHAIRLTELFLDRIINPIAADSSKPGGNMHIKWICVSTAILALCVLTTAQTYQGRILGTVMDPNGAVVKSAKISITNVETGATRTLETNEAGEYVAPNL